MSANIRALASITPANTMATNYIPAPDAAFAAWLSNFASLIQADPTDYGLVAGDATIITAQDTAFQAAYTLATDPSTRTSPTVAAKDAARATAEATVRPYAVQISLNSGVSDMLKVGVGVTVKKTVPTPVPPPTTVPALSLLAATPGAHQLAYRDTSTPTSKAKPPGAIGIELWRNIGTVAATDPAQCSYYAQWTKSPNVSNFTSSDVGKVCTYFARWATRGGPGGVSQVGPWSASLVISVI